MTTDHQPSSSPGHSRRALLLRNYYDREVQVDDVTGGAVLPVRVRRFTHAQLMAFAQGWSRIENPPSERAIYRRADEADVPMPEVRRRRLEEMPPADREAFAAREQQEAIDAAAFCCDQIRQHVWVHPDVDVTLEADNGEARRVQTGEDLVQAFGGNLEMLLLLTRIVFEENTLGAQKKRILRQLSDSSGSSPVRPPAAAGATPAETVAPAGAPACASPVGASGPHETSPSGLTE